MQAKDLVKLVEEIAQPILEENELEFVDAEFVKEGPQWYLRLYIDKNGGVDIDDCVLVSRKIDENLDDELTDQSYILEVSSPGIDRILKRDHEYIKYKDKDVDVKLYKAIDGVKEYQGKLVGLVDGNIVIIDSSGNEHSFVRKDVSTCRLVVKF